MIFNRGDMRTKTKKTRMVNISFTLPEELERQIAAAAQAEYTGKSQIIRDALRKAFGQKKAA